MKRLIILFFALLPLAGCTVGPDYTGPSLNIGSGWVNNSPDQESDSLQRWWERFADPQLNDLVERALAQNLDIRQSVERITQSRSFYRIATGATAPQIAGVGSATRRRQSENGPLPIDRIPGLDRDQTIFDVGFDASWEIDLFGGNRRAKEAAEARIGQSVEAWRNTQIRIVAEVVRRYAELRGAQEEYRVQQQIVAASRETLSLVERQLAVGEVSPAAVAQAASRLKAEEAKLPPVQADIQAAAYALSPLIADLPEYGLLMTEKESTPLNLHSVPLGIRADLLRRRPDIRSAERELVAATADVGVATAELFPKIRLLANGGFESLSGSSLLQSASQTWAVTPVISWNIFQGGQIRANITVQESKARELALAYEATVLAALTEAEQGISRYRAGLETLKRQDQAVAAANLDLKYSSYRYTHGDISLFELLETQQRLFSAQLNRSRLHEKAATDLVFLYKALGGGWQQSLDLALGEKR